METQYPIYLVTTRTRYILIATFVRFQEHYESSQFQNSFFTLEDFMDFYARENDGEFTFFSDWDGCNIPSLALKPFYEGRFNPLQRKERILLELFQNVPHPYYIIGAIERESDIFDWSILRHEFCHGLFSCELDYRKSILDCIQRFRKRLEPLYNFLRKSAVYCENVLDDEVHAYVLAGPYAYPWPRGFPKKLRPVRKELRAIYKNFTEHSIIDTKFILSSVHRVSLDRFL